MKVKGVLTRKEEKETNTGKKFYFITIGDISGSYWGKPDILKLNDEYEATYKVTEVDDRAYNNFKTITPTKKKEEKEPCRFKELVRAITLHAAVEIAPKFCEKTETPLDLKVIEAIANDFLDYLEKENE